VKKKKKLAKLVPGELLEAIQALHNLGLIEQLPNGEFALTELGRTGEIVVDHDSRQAWIIPRAAPRGLCFRDSQQGRKVNLP
jgi:hypothetical protein